MELVSSHANNPSRELKAVVAANLLPEPNTWSSLELTASNMDIKRTFALHCLSSCAGDEAMEAMRIPVFCIPSSCKSTFAGAAYSPATVLRCFEEAGAVLVAKLSMSGLIEGTWGEIQAAFRSTAKEKDPVSLSVFVFRPPAALRGSRAVPG